MTSSTATKREASTSTAAPASTAAVDSDGARNPIRRFFETNFGSESMHRGTRPENHNNMQELKDIKFVSPSAAAARHDEFDTCNEFSCSAEEDENDYFNSTPASGASEARDNISNKNDDAVLTHVLGKTYHPIRDYASKRGDESALFWFTYRCDFPEIAPYNITSDAGWGCMLRSAQMMLGQALRVHYRGRDWRPPAGLGRRRQDPFLRSALTWFADFPSATVNVYSLHNMVAAGLAKYDKLPGEWYGPGTACYVLRDLVDMHERQQQQQLQQQQASGADDNGSDTAAVGKQALQVERRIFRVHVAPHASVYRDSIEKLMTRDNKARREDETSHREGKKQPQPSHPLDVGWEDELVESADAVEWDTSLLLLIPLRLGLKGFNVEYIAAVAHAFSLPQSVGVLGGRPRGARWFYGALADGSKVFGLDPHTVQNAPRKRIAKVNGRASSVVDLSDDYLRSVHTTYPEIFSLEKMDPSIALGFYCRDRTDLERVFTSFREWKDSHPRSPDLFTVADVAPDYSANITSAMDDMTASILDDDGGDEGSEEDEYVML